MSSLAEHTLIKLLSDNDALTLLAREGIEPEVIPTEELRSVVEWALAYRTDGGKAPSVAAMTDRFEDILNDNEIDLEDEPEDTIEWAIAKLHSSYVYKRSAIFCRELVTEIADAEDEVRVDVLAEKAAELAALVQKVSPRRNRVDLRSGGMNLYEDYQAVVANGGAAQGMLFGLPEIDEYTRGIHNGELCIVGAPSKMGKSFALDFVAEKEWERGRGVALFTLENSIPMTMQRIGCMALNISLEQLALGTLDEEDHEKLRYWVHDVLPQSDVPLHIFNPQPSMRSPQAIVQQARAVGADSLIVDQLTFMEEVKDRTRANANQSERVGRMLHDLKSLISTNRHQMPCLLAHQFNREGTKAANRSGQLDMGDLANSSETERTADWVFGLYASHDQRVTNRMELQTLATRRASSTKNFEMIWAIDIGRIAVRREIHI